MSTTVDTLGSDCILPEQRLFVGVIVNAALEAAGGSRVLNRGGDRARAQAHSLAWFRDAGEDFQIVCSLAGLEPENVRAGVLAYVDKVAAYPGEVLRHRRPRARSDRYSPGNKPQAVTIRDVAAHAGVSTMTVNRVRAHHPRVSHATRTRVISALQQFGYDVPSANEGSSLVH